MEKKILLSLRYITLHQNHKIAIGGNLGNEFCASGRAKVVYKVYK